MTSSCPQKSPRSPSAAPRAAGYAPRAAREAQDLAKDAQAPTNGPSDPPKCWKYNKNQRFLMISRAACDAQRAPSGPPRALQKRPGDTLGSPQGPRGASLGPPGAAKEPPGTHQEPPSSLPERPESAQAPPEDAPDALGAARDAQDLDKDAHAPTTRPSDQPNCWKYYKNQRFLMIPRAACDAQKHFRKPLGNNLGTPMAPWELPRLSPGRFWRALGGPKGAL